MRHFLFAILVALALPGAAFAQATGSLPGGIPWIERPAPSAPIDPGAIPPVGRPGESLSDTLERQEGVIDPGVEAGPEMLVRPPDPAPNTTPVIPPPGSPGGDPTLQPTSG